MKINEKNLSAYSTSASPVDKEGWLCKRGELNKGFQRRWFVLKGNLLFYFERNGSTEPIGVIILEGCSIELAENDNQFSFKIVFHGPNNRSYTLGADSQESMEQWMKSLACASYDYMKSMVANLESQLKKLENMTVPVVPSLTLTDAKQNNKSNENSSQPSTSGRINPFDSKVTRNRRTPSPHRRRNIWSISFKELHSKFGRPILKDRNERIRLCKKQEVTNVEPLIAL